VDIQYATTMLTRRMLGEYSVKVLTIETLTRSYVITFRATQPGRTVERVAIVDRETLQVKQIVNA
jgi:hypothetical protein